MKKVLFIILVLFSCAGLFCQEAADAEESVISEVETTESNLFFYAEGGLSASILLKVYPAEVVGVEYFFTPRFSMSFEVRAEECFNRNPYQSYFYLAPVINCRLGFMYGGLGISFSNNKAEELLDFNLLLNFGYEFGDWEVSNYFITAKIGFQYCLFRFVGPDNANATSTKMNATILTEIILDFVPMPYLGIKISLPI